MRQRLRAGCEKGVEGDLKVPNRGVGRRSERSLAFDRDEQMLEREQRGGVLQHGCEHASARGGQDRDVERG